MESTNKERVIAILTDEREKYSKESTGIKDNAGREEELFNRLAPYMRIDFPKDHVKTLLSDLQSTDNFADALDQILAKLEKIWEGERRGDKDRRSEQVQRIELESGKFIWHDVRHTRCGFERRTQKDRRA